MQYNKNKFNKVNDKKVMKKVKKQWIVVSVATLALLGSSAYSVMTTSPVVAHADGTQQGATTQGGGDSQQESQSQRDAESLAAAQSKAAAQASGTADGSNGASQSTSYGSYQADYDAAYSTASTAASSTASSAGASDFAAGHSLNSSYHNHQDAYTAAWNASSNATVAAASSAGASDFAAGHSLNSSYGRDQDVYTSAWNNASSTASSAASANAVSAGISDFIKGSSHNSKFNSARQSTYDTAYSMASSGFYATLNSSAASGANTSDASYQAGSSYAVQYSSVISAAINDVVMSNGNNMSSYASDQAKYYSAAYAGAQTAINAYSNATQGNGTGTQDYNYYNNTANTSYTSGNGSTPAVNPNINKSNWGQGSSASYNSSAAASYTGSYNDNYQANKGGADNPNDAYNSVISYENDLGLKFNNAQNTSVKIGGQNATSGTANIKVASQSDVHPDNSSFYGALTDVYNYSIPAALAKQGMVDAEKGKWTGVIGDGTAKGQTQDFYLANNPNVTTSSTNPYDQGYLGAKAAMAAQFNGGNSVQSISAIDASSKQDKNYIAAYNDVVNQAAQNVIFVSTGKQFDGIMNNSTLLNQGFTIKLVNDIDLHSVTKSQENNVGVNAVEGKIYVVDGQNHIADMSGQQYKFSTGTTSNTKLYVQNFQTLYGTNYYGPFSLSNGGSIYYKNVNYVGSQILSAKGNYVYVDGNVNVFQRDDVYDSPFMKSQNAEGSGNQNNLSIANMVLNKGAHYFGSVGTNTGSNVVYISGGGNLTLGEDSSMTLIPRGNATGGDDGADQGPMGVDIQNGSLTVNKNANLNIMPDYSNTYPQYGAGGGIYVGSNGGVRVDGGRINIESNQSPKMAGQVNALLYVQSGSNVLATNGGTIQVKVAHIGDSRAPSGPTSGGGLVYLAGGTVQVANRGNLISAISDGTGSGVPLVYGNLIVNNSGDSHVILDAGTARNSNGGNANPFVNNGTINSYTGKVNGTIYYNYQMNASSQYTSTDQYLHTTSNTPYSGGQILDISSIPSVYFANPISAKTNSDGSITVSGIAKVTGYDGSDYAKQNVYLQYGIDKNKTTDYNDSGMNTFLTTDSNGNKVQYSNPATDSTGKIVDNKTYSATSSSNVDQIPISFTIPADQASGINTVGVYMRYGVNGIYMVATPNSTGGSDYSSSIVGYSAGSNGQLNQDPAATVQVNSGKGQDITDGFNNAIADAINGTNSKDPLRYQKNNDYTGEYDSVLSGYKAATPQYLQSLGITDPTKAPSTLTPDLLAKIQESAEYKQASNPTAFMQGLQQAYADYLANAQAANDIANASPAAAAAVANGSQDAAYKKNYAASYNTAQQALTDAIAGNQDNKPADSDSTGQQVYAKAQQQYRDAQQAMTEAANGTTNNPNNLDPTAYTAAQNAYNQIVNDVKSGKKESTNDSPLNTMSPLQQALYQQQYDAIKAKYTAGQQSALSGSKTTPTDQAELAGYNASKDGFNGANNTAPENQSPAYIAGQKAKSDSQDGINQALQNASAQSNPNDSDAKKDGLQAAKDAYAVVSGQQTPLTDDQLAQKSLAYQSAYNAALSSAKNTVAQAQNDYKNGSSANKPQGNGVDAVAYNKAQSDATQGATDAQSSTSATPDQSKTPAYQEGYNIAKGTADALSGSSIDNSPNKSQDYKDAYNAAADGFNGSNNTAPENQTTAYKAGQQAKTDSQTGADLATKGQSLPATPKPSQAETDGFNATNDAYNDVQNGSTSLPDFTGKSLAYKDAYTNAFNAAKPVVSNALSDYKNGSTDNKPADLNSAAGKAYKAVKDAAAQGASDANQQGSSATPDSSKTPAYQEGYNIAKGSSDALNGADQNPANTSSDYADAYKASKDGFNGSNNNAPENQTAAYKAGQQAKTDSQAGADLATNGQSLPTNPSQAETDGYNAAKNAYDTADGKKAAISDADLAKKSLAYQDAYKKALAAANTVVDNAKDDYKNGSTTHQPTDPNSAAGKAYQAVKDDAAQGASDANQENSSDTPDASQTPAYKEGYNIAKGESDAQNGKQQSSTNTDPDYTNAFANFNNGKALGEQANATLPGNADQATKDGFAYGQGIAALKSAKNPEDSSVSQGLTGKQLDGFNAAKSGYEAAMAGQPAPTTPQAAVEGYNYAKALTDGAAASSRPTQATGNDDLATEQKAYDDTQAAIAQAKADVKAGKTGSQLTPNDSNASNKNVYDNAYKAAVKAYQNTDPNATAASAGITSDAVGSSAFASAKADGLKVQGAKAFTDGKANTQNDPNYTAGYNDAKQGYVDALKGNAAPENPTDAYNSGAAAGTNDKAGFNSAENGNPDSSQAAQGAAAAIAAVKAAKGNVSNMPYSNDSSKSAAYNNAYNAALDDAKAAAQQGIASQTTPDSTNTQAPVPAALADVYKAAANDTQKGYAEGLTGKSVSDSSNASEQAGNTKGAADKAKYEAAVNDYNNGITDPSKALNSANANDPVYQETMKALNDADKGNTDPSDNSPVYAVANSQALANKDAVAAIKQAIVNGTTPAQMTEANVPAGVKDKTSYMNAYNEAVNGYNAGNTNSNGSATNSDPADQKAFADGKALGQAARGANDALNGTKSNADVSADLNSTDPDKKSYAQGVTDANNGYAQGLSDTTPMSATDLAAKTPAFQKAYAQGHADKTGVDAAKSQSNPDANNVPSSLSGQAADAYKGYAAAVNAVKNANGSAKKDDRPSDFASQSADYKAAYQKAMSDAVDANAAGLNSVVNPSQSTRPSDAANQAVYDAARGDASKGYAEGLTGKAQPSGNANEVAGYGDSNTPGTGAGDKAKYEAAVNDYNNGITDPTKASNPANANDPVYQETMKALNDAATGKADSTDNSPVYAVANSQGLGQKDAQTAINQAIANGTTPAQMTEANVPAGVKDKTSYMNAYNDAVKGYNDAKQNQSGQATNSDPADRQAYANGRLLGQAARGASDALNGKKSNADVAADLNSTDPETKAYAQGVTDANNGFNDGLTNPTAPVDTTKSPAYQQAFKQAQSDAKGYNEAKASSNPSSQNVPGDIANDPKASDAYKGYADAVNAIRDGKGNKDVSYRPDGFDSQTPDYKAAYQKAIAEAVNANKAGEDSILSPSTAAARPTDNATGALYDKAQHDTKLGYAEGLSGRNATDPNNKNEADGLAKGSQDKSAYAAAVADFNKGIKDPSDNGANASYKNNPVYQSALKGLTDGNATPASDSHDDQSPVYAIAKQQAQNVQNALNAAKNSSNVAQNSPKADQDLASVSGYSNTDNQPDMKDAYNAASQAYHDANTNQPDISANLTSPAAKMAYEQAYKAAQADQGLATQDFTNGNKSQRPNTAADAAVYDQTQADITSGLNDGLNGSPDSGKQNANPAYKQGADYAAAVKAATNDVINGNQDGKSNLTDAQAKDYNNIADAINAAKNEYLSHPDNYVGKTGSDLANAAQAAAQAAYPNDPLRRTAFANFLTHAGDAYSTGADKFAQNASEPAGIAKAGYDAAKAAYNAVANNQPANTASSTDGSNAYKNTYQKAFDKYKADASQGAVALFTNNDANDPNKAASVKESVSSADNNAFNTGVDNAKAALVAAQTKQPFTSTDANSPANDVYNATKDAYNAVLNGQAPQTDAELSQANKSDAYKAAYKSALSQAQVVATAGSNDDDDNSQNYKSNPLAVDVYQKAQAKAKQAYNDALANTDPNLTSHNGNDKGSVTYKAVQNAINDYLANNNKAHSDGSTAGISDANKDSYSKFYNKAQADIEKAVQDGIRAYENGTPIDNIAALEGANAALGQVAKEAATRAKQGHDDAKAGTATTSNLANDEAYLAGRQLVADEKTGHDAAVADTTNKPNGSQAVKDGFDATVAAYKLASEDGTVDPNNIDAYIKSTYPNASVAFADNFKSAYQEGLDAAKKGSDAFVNNGSDSTNGQNGAAQLAQHTGYDNAHNAFLARLNGTADNQPANSPTAQAGRAKADVYLDAVQDAVSGKVDKNNTDSVYTASVASAQSAMVNSIKDAKANWGVTPNFNNIPVPDGSDPDIYRSIYKAMYLGYNNGYGQQGDASNGVRSLAGIAFRYGFGKGTWDLPAPDKSTAPTDLLNNAKKPDSAFGSDFEVQQYNEEYKQASDGFDDGIKGKGQAGFNKYYTSDYNAAQSALAGMKLAQANVYKSQEDMLKENGQAFVNGYNGYLQGLNAAKRSLKENKKLSKKDLVGKDRAYVYTFKEGLKAETKIQKESGAKAGIKNATKRGSIPSNIYDNRSDAYAKSYIKAYKQEMKRTMPKYIYNVKTIFTHSHVKFSNETRVKKYAYTKRYNSTVFKVTGIAYYKNGVPRYRLSNGDVVTAGDHVENAYYQHNYKEYKVIKPTGVLVHTAKKYTNDNVVRRLKRGETIKIQKVVKYHGLTRLYVGKGEYITSNKTYVQKVDK
ncbi:hypothetical protein AP1H75_11230 [Apilactobacillus apinorum]|uniref:DUF5776 domain-containing protein n=1 Tax=Apilactobacillus apinorum TaxID=1218495 RepID=UPI0030E9496C